MKERPILFSKILGRPSMVGQRLKSKDGLTWKQRNAAAVAKRRRELYALNKPKHQEKSRSYRRANPAKVLAYNGKWRRRFFGALRRELIEAYGGRCACCSEVEPVFLDIDHINNDGKSDRALRGNGQRLMVWLKANGWPRDRYQLLCSNCNQGKVRNGGVCPHLARRTHVA